MIESNIVGKFLRGILNPFRQLLALKFATKWSFHQTTREASPFITSNHMIEGLNKIKANSSGRKKVKCKNTLWEK